MTRITSILNFNEPDELSRKDFEILNKNQARQVVKLFIRNNKLIEQIVGCIEDKLISGFVLKDIMKTNFSMDQIKKTLKEKQEEIKSVDEQKAMSIFFLKNEEEEKKETDE